MKSNKLVLGFFHECCADQVYKNSIDDFRRSNGGHVLFKTDNTEIWAFYGPNADSDLQSAWSAENSRTTYFETIDSPSEWVDTWAGRFPITLNSILEVR